MKFTLNEELNTEQRKALIKALCIVSEKYFNAEHVSTSCGICSAVFYQNIKNADYDTMGRLMNEILEPRGMLGKYTNEREEWEQRANMCLLLAEYLKDTIND